MVLTQRQGGCGTTTASAEACSPQGLLLTRGWVPLPPPAPSPTRLQYFSAIDTNRSGTLDVMELQKALALGGLHFRCVLCLVCAVRLWGVCGRRMAGSSGPPLADLNLPCCLPLQPEVDTGEGVHQPCLRHLRVCCDVPCRRLSESAGAAPALTRAACAAQGMMRLHDRDGTSTIDFNVSPLH